MKKIFLMLPLLFAIVSCNNKNVMTEDSQLNTMSDSISYSLGVILSHNLKSDTFYGELNPSKFVAGFKDFFNDNSEISIEDAEKILTQYSADKRLEQMDAEKKKNEEFMAKNAQKEGIITTKSGLQYEILEKGNGQMPDTNDNVYIHYKGWMIDGTVFDALPDTQESIKLNIKGLLPGLTQALSMMREGDKWKIYIPYNLAYGEFGFPNSPVKPYSTLIYEIKLIKVEKQ